MTILLVTRACECFGYYFALFSSEPMWGIEARNAAIANSYYTVAVNRVGTVGSLHILHYPLPQVHVALGSACVYDNTVR